MRAMPDISRSDSSSSGDGFSVTEPVSNARPK
jgi:hypothetical protein